MFSISVSFYICLWNSQEEGILTLPWHFSQWSILSRQVSVILRKKALHFQFNSSENEYFLMEDARFLDFKVKIVFNKNYTGSIEFGWWLNKLVILPYSWIDICKLLPYGITIWKLPWNETQIISYSRRFCYFVALTIYGNGKMCTNCDLERRIASRGM